MKQGITFVVILLSCLASFAQANTPNLINLKCKSLARENKPHSYYVRQAELTSFIHDSNQGSVDAQNLNYLKPFKIVYNHYKLNKNFEKAEKIKSLAFLIGNRSDDNEFINKINLDFK